MRLHWIALLAMAHFTAVLPAQCGLAWKIGAGPGLVGAGDLIGGSFGGGLQWNRRFIAWGMETRFQTVTQVVKAGDEFSLPSRYRIYKQHNGMQFDLELMGRLPIWRLCLYAGGGPSLVWYRQLTQDWVAGNSEPDLYFRHLYSDFGNRGFGYHYLSGLDYFRESYSAGLFLKVSNYGGTKTIASLNVKYSRSLPGLP